MPATNINLAPRTDFDKTPFGKFLRWSLTYGRYIIVCTEIIVLMAFIFRFTLDRNITDLNEEVEQKEAIITANQPFELQFRKLQSRMQNIQELFTDQNLSLDLLKHLNQITPAGILFNTYTFSGSNINISAVSQSDTSLAVFIDNLKKSDNLSDVNLLSLSKKGGGGNESSFNITAKIRK